MSKMTRQDWLNLDWSKSNKEIVGLTGKTLATVNSMRSRLGKSTPKQTRPPTDWDSVDWSLDNKTLAAKLDLAYDTVARKRMDLQAGKSDKIATRSDKGISKTTYVPSTEQQQQATEAAKQSDIAGKSVNNIHAKEWILIAPDDKIYRITNLHHFVRNNPHLFNPKDVEWKRKGSKRGAGGEYCNATAGLSNVRGGKSNAWKGWRLKNTSE